MSGATIRETTHWNVAGGASRADVHLVFTPLVVGRAADLSYLPLVEREDLQQAIVDEVGGRGLSERGYGVYTRCMPGGPLQIHLMAQLGTPTPGGPCIGNQLTEPAGWAPDDDEIGLLFDVANAMQCPLCGTRVKRWRIHKGVIGHDPGE